MYIRMIRMRATAVLLKSLVIYLVMSLAHMLFVIGLTVNLEIGVDQDEGSRRGLSGRRERGSTYTEHARLTNLRQRPRPLQGGGGTANSVTEHTPASAKLGAARIRTPGTPR